jgi:hypothetical protein
MKSSNAFRFARVWPLAMCVAVVSPGRGAIAQQEGQQAWLIQPTEQHKLLQQDVGTWDATMKLWESPGAEPMESKATEKNELLGGMWLVSRFEGKIGDMPFTGIGTFGYDPVEKKYVGTWIDTLSPYMMTMKGDYDADKKTTTLMGEGRDAVTGNITKTKLISRSIDDDTRVFEMHMPGENGEFWKMMEIEYQRRTE